MVVLNRYLLKSLVLALSILFTVLTCFASEPEDVLTLTQILSIAEQKNFQLAIADLALKKSKQKILQSEAEGMVSLEAGLIYRYVDNLELFGDDQAASEGIASGHVVGSQLTFDPHIFEIRKRANIVEREKLRANMAQLDKMQIHQQLVFDIIKAFYNSLLDQKKLHLNESMRLSANMHLEETLKLYDEGKVPKYDVLQSRVRLANMETTITRAVNSLKRNKQKLARLAGLDASAVFHLAGSFDSAPQDYNYDDSLKMALANRLDLRKMKFDKMISEKSIAIDGARTPPSFSLLGEYSLRFLQNEGTDELDAYRVDVRFSMPLFEKSHISRKKQAMLETSILDMRIQDLKSEIAFSIRENISRMEEARQVIEQQKNSLDLAKESLRMAEIKYEGGKATSFEVEDSRSAMFQAEIDYLQARHDYITGELEYLRAVGELPEIAVGIILEVINGNAQ